MIALMVSRRDRKPHRSPASGKLALLKRWVRFLSLLAFRRYRCTRYNAEIWY